MLHVLFVLLKILGIFLLVLLGVLLLVLVSVLLVPVRYRLDGAYQKTLAASAVVSWFLGLVSVRAVYDGVLCIKARLLWFILFEERLFGPEEAGQEEHQPEDTLGAEDRVGENAAGAEKVQEPESMPMPAEPSGFVGALELQEKPEEPEESKKDTEGILEPDKKGLDKEDAGAARPGFFGRLYEKILSLFKRICGWISWARAKAEQGQRALERVWAFWDDTENKKTAALLVSQTKKLLFHVLPRRLKGRLRFGFGDPYRTGQVLTAVSPFYALYAKSFTLEPVFDKKILDGEIHVRGRIRAGTLAWIGLRILMNRNFRRLLRKWKEF
ncbi:MAG: DUF2953 domain-containing protein [Lachnospiraceae bacterium]|nr:DUF2953 domain-containing protein [Lachnospiraceae bacterium]